MAKNTAEDMKYPFFIWENSVLVCGGKALRGSPTIVCSVIMHAPYDHYVMPLNKSWHDYNESLIEHGRILMDIGFLKSTKSEPRLIGYRYAALLSLVLGSHEVISIKIIYRYL